MSEILDDIWAEEGGIQLRLLALSDGSIAFQIADITKGWEDRRILGQATMAGFRLPRIISAITKQQDTPR